MKECTHQEILNWFLCEHAQRRGNDIWLNSGHPCRFSIGSWEGVIYCNYEANKETGAGSQADISLKQTKTGQE